MHRRYSARGGGCARVLDKLRMKPELPGEGATRVIPADAATGQLPAAGERVESTPEIEKKFVHHVYDAIAPHFSATRFARWPKVAAFLGSLPRGSLVLDAGCGNGKYLGVNADCLFLGCDISAPLVNICASRGHEVLVADAVGLPFRSGYGDAAISVAVLHHLSTEGRRRKAVEELVRVVRRGGHVLITVWAVEQEDQSLLAKWTPLGPKYDEEWVNASASPQPRSPSSALSLESIPEAHEHPTRSRARSSSSLIPLKGIVAEEPAGPRAQSPSLKPIIADTSTAADEKPDGSRVPSPSLIPSKGIIGDAEKPDAPRAEGTEMGLPDDDVEQQEYFVPWHLPYHRAEVGGASAAIASGFAKKDDQKGAVVYNRYYHVFKEGELQRLVAGIEDAVVADQFYDKSNWCIVLQKT
ncbi:unnamed protein product [Spirodela intermedia]|uniref:Methyltransferase type 11 domain-containing protein n=1 Tax=Spirodela intermedia TaxID=51605 RepID=A0A7I8KT72_SPIIN|nr:unnamed protein product [Spirodela intermedia]